MNAVWPRRSGRMVQMEIALDRQQRQLDELRQALSKVVDIAVHRLHKEQVFSQLANKANVEQLEQLERNQQQETANAGRELLDALAKKADTLLVEEQQSLVQQTKGQISALQQQQQQVASSIADLSSEQLQEQEQLSAVRERLATLSCRHEQLMAVVEGKADSQVFEYQEQLLEGTQKHMTQLEERLVEMVRQQLSTSLSTELRRDALQRADEVAILQQREALTAVKAHMEVLEQKWQQRLESEIERVSRQQEQQEERLTADYFEKAHIEEMNRRMQVYENHSEKLETEVNEALDSKADVCWFEQHQQLLNAAQVSLGTLNKDQKDFRMEVRAHLRQVLADKVDHKLLQENKDNVQADLNSLRLLIEKSKKEVHNLWLQLGDTRTQMVEVKKNVEELQASVASKASQACMEQQQQSSQTLHDQVTSMMQQVKLVAYTQATMCSKDVDTNAGTLVHPPSCPRNMTGLESGVPRLPGTGPRSPYRNFKRK